MAKRFCRSILATFKISVATPSEYRSHHGLLNGCNPRRLLGHADGVMLSRLGWYSPHIRVPVLDRLNLFVIS